MDQLKEMGEFVRSASSTIEAPVVRRLKEAFTTKATDQPAHGNQGSQGSRPRPGGPAAPRDGAAAGGSQVPRPRPDNGVATAPQGVRDDAPAAAGRRDPEDCARRDGQRLRGAGGRARRCRRERHRAGTRRGGQAAAAGPGVAGLPAGRAAAPGRSRRPAGARAAAYPGHSGRLPQSGWWPGNGQCPAPGAAPQHAGRCSRAAPRWRPRVVRTRAVRVPGRPRPGRRDQVPPVRERPGPAGRVRAPAPRVPAPGRVTTRSARPRPAWVRRRRPGLRVRPRLAGKAVPLLRAAPLAAPAGLVLADAVPVGPRVPACPMVVRVPRARVPAVPGRAR